MRCATGSIATSGPGGATTPTTSPDLFTDGRDLPLATRGTAGRRAAAVGRDAIVAAWLDGSRRPERAGRSTCEPLAVNGSLGIARCVASYVATDRAPDRADLLQHLAGRPGRGRPLPRVHRVLPEGARRARRLTSPEPDPATRTGPRGRSRPGREAGRPGGGQHRDADPERGRREDERRQSGSSAQAEPAAAETRSRPPRRRSR